MQPAWKVLKCLTPSASIHAVILCKQFWITCFSAFCGKERYCEELKWKKTHKQNKTDKQNPNLFLGDFNPHYGFWEKQWENQEGLINQNNAVTFPPGPCFG